jgi:hypothetical protein
MGEACFFKTLGFEEIADAWHLSDSRSPRISPSAYNHEMESAINRICFVLTWLCLLGLVCGMVYEARTHVLLFKDYISAFFGWACIFAFICFRTRQPKAIQADEYEDNGLDSDDP